MTPDNDADPYTMTDENGQQWVQVPAPMAMETGDHPRMRRRRLLTRRLIGVGVIIVIGVAIYWTIFHSGLLDPLLAYVEPAREGIDWVLADPTRAWTALAVIVIPHIGMFLLLFDDQR